MKCILREKNHKNIIANARKRNEQLKGYIFYESDKSKVKKYQNEIAVNNMKIQKWIKEGLA